MLPALKFTRTIVHPQDLVPQDFSEQATGQLTLLEVKILLDLSDPWGLKTVLHG